jgi:hypothetical protein
MDQIPQPYAPRARVAADGETVLSKVNTLWRRCIDTVERSRICIARSEQRMAASDRRMNGRTIAPRQPRRPDNRINRQALREQLRATRARSELLLRQTRDTITRSRALMIEPR